MSKTQWSKEDLHGQLHKAARAIGAADALLISAGAGLGVDSGLPDFRGKKGFWQAYPAAERLGLAFADLANPRWFTQNPRLAWGFYGHRLNLYRRTVPHAGFAWLLAMGRAKQRGYFVLTSNVDGQFQAAGFDADCIEECHGSIHYLQCTQSCGDHIWHAHQCAVSIDSESLRAISELPICQHCGALARPNILMFDDTAWVEQRTREQGERLWQWLEGLLVATQRLVIVEIGAGQTVPTIRRRSEFYAKLHQATLIRINPDDYQVSNAHHISLPMAGMEAMEAIWQLWCDDGQPEPT